MKGYVKYIREIKSRNNTRMKVGSIVRAFEFLYVTQSPHEHETDAGHPRRIRTKTASCVGCNEYAGVCVYVSCVGDEHEISRGIVGQER
ncbi:hypothetical protein SUGI_0336130 [Cryptomeria japonica]|nr:hypothetical protein SUGI_0336130 [Cryptomeria japonica]